MTRMFHSQELSDLLQGKRLFVLSRVHVGGSEQLCRALLEEDYAPEFASSRAVGPAQAHGEEQAGPGRPNDLSRRVGLDVRDVCELRVPVGLYSKNVSSTESLPTAKKSSLGRPAGSS